MQVGFDFDIGCDFDFKLLDFENIKNTVPQLYPEQQEDIYAIEQRFQVGKGYLCTNGTGTGKTYVGLGTMKRFFLQGKSQILVVVPTEQKCKDWIEDGEDLNLNITLLKDIRDKGRDMVITTYANFYQNKALLERTFDLVIYDECHYLNQNAQGKETAYMTRHKTVTNLPSAARIKAIDDIGVLDYETMPKMSRGEFMQLEKQWGENVKERMKFYVAQTKVLLLSATPFAYHKSLKLGDGLIFDIEEVIDPPELEQGYNTPNGFEKFLCENLGYRMRYDKCTIPETGVDVDLLEREFFEKYREKGVMSTRVLNLPYDYSREFVILNSEIGHKIDKGIELFYTQDFKDKYKYLAEVASRQFNYLFMNQLLECIKAKEVIPRISHHLLLGRKIVIFHSYNNTTMWHPFRFNFDKLLNSEDTFYMRDRCEIEMKMFEKEYPEFYYMDLSELDNVPNTIKKMFPTAECFNGTIPKKKRKFHKDIFCEDYSEIDILITQTKAGREGISLHDESGVHQRVIINCGLPVAPTQAIQEEGRIYRSGLMSNAAYEYATLQTNSERFAFATKIAERAKTAENFAMGNLARDLERAFKDGYINASEAMPYEDQGVGGKEADRKEFTSTEFDRAITYYYSNLNKTAKNKSAEGNDYFATPEPLGLRMVEWCKAEPGQKFLEPSAGHGAIARWFPKDCDNVMVEQSYKLASILAINATGDVEIQDFERYHIINKFDYILMNPPFGNSGKTAMEHVEKACIHLSRDYGSKLYAIVPAGPSMQKRLDEFYESREFEKLHLSGELMLPAITFNRAGTSVMCKIVKIERVGVPSHLRQELTLPFRQIDLTHITEVKDFFETLRELEF